MAIYLSPFEYVRRMLGGIYMETGFLDLLSTGRCTEDAYKPATLNYTGDIATYVTTTDTPLQGRVTEDFVSVLDEAPFTGEALLAASESLAAGCESKLPEIIDPCENVYSATYVDDEPITAVLGEVVPVTQLIGVGKSVVVTNEGGGIEYVRDVDYYAHFSGIQPLSGGDILESQALKVSYYPSLYCSPALQTKKDAQEKVPSSMFSGKMRLFIQAVYGSVREDYERDGFNLKLGSVGNTNYPPFALNRGFTNNSWLYTSANYDYFLCTYKGASIEFRQIDLHPAAQSFRDILVGHARFGEFDFATKIEAYILSTGQINPTVYATVPIVGDVINGSPLDYGWHSTWGGEEATVVCFYADVPNSRYLSDQHQLTVGETWDGDDYIFTVNNVRLQSDMVWWPWTNGLHVFYYDEVLQSMLPVDYPNPVPGGFTGTFDSPVYCYYALDTLTGLSELVTVNIHMDVQSRPNVNHNLTGDKVYSPASHNFINIRHYIGDSGVKGFRVGGSSKEILVEELTFKQEADVTQLGGLIIDEVSGSLFGRIGDAQPMSDSATTSSQDYIESLGYSVGETREVDEDTQYLCFMKRRFRWGAVTTSYGSGSKVDGNLFFQTMLGNCSSVIVGKEETTSHSGKSTVTESRIDKALGGKLFWSTQNPLNFLNPTVTEFHSEMPGPNFVHALPTYEDNTDPGPTDTVVEPAQPETTTINMFEYSEGALNEVVVTDDSLLGEYFTPTTVDKPTHTVDIGRLSVGDQYKTDHASFSKDGGFIYDSAVGWS